MTETEFLSGSKQSEQKHQPVRFSSKFTLGCDEYVESIRPYPMNILHLKDMVENVIVDEFSTPLLNCIDSKSKQYYNDVLRWCAYFTHGEYFKDNRTFGFVGMTKDSFALFFADAIAHQMSKSVSPVLLIDGNIKSGSLHSLYGNIDVPIGLAEVLSFRNGFGEAVVLNEADPNLHLLSCGNLESDVFELLGDGRFGELIETLKSHCTRIFVILPPVLVDSSALLIANALDSIVLCVQQHNGMPTNDFEKNYGKRIIDIDRAFQDLLFTGSYVNGFVQYFHDTQIQ
jgi:hypothetical protein